MTCQIFLITSFHLNSSYYFYRSLYYGLEGEDGCGFGNQSKIASNLKVLQWRIDGPTSNLFPDSLCRGMLRGNYRQFTYFTF